MDDKIKISVIVPVYNTEEYLTECFDSIFNQTMGDIEVIAIDDGSVDGSFKKLQEIQNKHSNLSVKTQKNIGLGATRNVGIRGTTGKYIYFMDSDDIIEADFFEKSLNILEKTGADFVGFQADIFGDTDGKDKRQYMYVDNYLSNLEEYNGVDFQKKYHWVMPLYNIPFCIYRRSFIENNSLYFMEGVLHEDTEFYWHMMTNNPKFVLSREVMYHRRYRHNSIMTGTNWEYSFKSKLQVYKKISEEANEKLRDVHLYYAISSIDKTLKEDNDRVLQLSDDNCRFIADLLNEIIEKSSELSILHEVFILDVIEKIEKMGFRFRNEDIIKKGFKDNPVIFFYIALYDLSRLIC